MSQKIALLDGNSFLHRMTKTPALQTMFTSTGQLTGPLFGGLKSLRYALATDSFTDCYVMWDSGKSPERKALYPSYKDRGVRDPTYFDMFDNQYNWMTKFFVRLGVKCVKFDYPKEADDLIYMLCKMYQGIPDSQITIISDDWDFAQMVGNNISLFRPLKQDLYTSLDQLGYPSRDALIWVKSVCGDGSDIIPGVPGVQKGTALPLVALFPQISVDNFEELMKGMSKRSKREDAILANVELIKRNCRLVDLSKEPNTGAEYEALTHKLCNQDAHFNDAEIYQLIQALEMHTLAKDLSGWLRPFSVLRVPHR